MATAAPKDYKEQSVTGKVWRRCIRVVCENVFGQTPSIQFIEEDRISAGGISQGKSVAGIYEQFTDPNKSFPILNPANGEPTGVTMTDAQLYAALYSRYINSAKARDAAEAAAAVTPDTTPLVNNA